uniref:Uncharacterized protein n=1 Tax=Xenopus tropicalis TaxID=8364 RepID=A0A1B8Y946_XENTR
MSIGLLCSRRCAASSAEFLCVYNILDAIAQTTGSPWITAPSSALRSCRRCGYHKRRRGCWGGVLARLRRWLHRPLLPSIFLSNARSLANKLDEWKLRIATEKILMGCCILLITETWLNPCIPDSAIELARLHSVSA